MSPQLRLGEALVRAGIIDDFQLQSALGQQRKWGGRLGKALLDLGFLDETTLIKFLSEQLKFSAIDLSKSRIAAQTFEALPKRVAEKYLAVPVVIRDTPGKKTMVLAMADPTDLKAIDEIEFLTNFRIEPVVALESSIQSLLQNYGLETSAAIVAEEDERQAIALEDKGGERIMVVHGDMEQVASLQTEHPQGTAPAEHAAPVSAQIVGEGEFDLSAPEPGMPFEEIPATVEDDTPLEMAPPEPVEEHAEIHDPNEDSGIYEPAETIDENEDSGVFEPAEAIDDGEDSGIFEEAETLEDEDKGHEFAIAETIENRDDFFGSPHEPLIAETTQSAESLEDDEVSEGMVVEEDDEAVIEEAEPLDETEEVEAVVENAPDAEIVDQSVAETPENEENGEFETGHVAEAVIEDHLQQAEAIVEPEHIENVEHIIDEAASAQPAEEPVPTTAASRREYEKEITALRTEINSLKQKFEGFTMMFVLKEQGKLSLEEFIEEIKRN